MSVKRATVKDVAMEAQVTAQTVSRVFRNKGYVSETTRAAVLAAAEKLNYVPNNAAISLRMGKSKSIAVVFDSLINIYFAVIVNYLHQEIYKLGYSLQTIFVHSTTINDEIYRSAVSMGAAGVISFLEPCDGLGGTVANCGVPLLILGRSTTQSEIDYIVTDDVKGGRLAAEHLLANGCKNMVCLADGIGITCIDDRYKGFEQVLSERGMSTKIVSAVIDDDSLIGSLTINDKIADGIFCCSDIVAYRLIGILDKNNLSEIKVVGFDNLQADIPLYTKITTIGADKLSFVRDASAKLINKIESRAKTRIVDVIDIQLTQGVTT